MCFCILNLLFDSARYSYVLVQGKHDKCEFYSKNFNSGSNECPVSFDIKKSTDNYL